MLPAMRQAAICHAPVSTASVRAALPGAFTNHHDISYMIFRNPKHGAIPYAVCAFLSLAVSNAMAAIKVDGKLDETEWAQARQFTDFKITEPYSLTGPDAGTGTRARMLSTPDGIAIAFELEQDAALRRVKPRLQRDQTTRTDKVAVMLDFDGDGQTAYSFSVGLSGAISDGMVTNENVISYDWDTDWSSAVVETETGWQVEMLIPWTVATMRGQDAPTRTVAVHFSRTLGSTGVVQATPAESIERGRFLSAFSRVEIAQYRTALFHYWPYVTANHGFIDDQTKYRAGVDLFWKPSPTLQLSATVNPDFGQVEADALVVNFDAVETFFSDKRPFFTENQGIFNLSTPNGGRLVHTRRIGGNADDGSGAADIDAALKLNGSYGGLKYGVLVASESDAAGRDFYAARLLYPVTPALNVGWLGTKTERPHLDRTANVEVLDVNWKPGANLVVNAQALGSFIKQQGKQVNDTGGWVSASWTQNDNWRHALELTHFGRDLNYNDLGYQRRASLNSAQAVTEYTAKMADAQSVLRSTRWKLVGQAQSNDRGDRLPPFLTLSNYLNFRSGDLIFIQASAVGAGWDDLISRNNGMWRVGARNKLEAQFVGRRRGDWALGAVASFNPRGLSSEVGKLLGLSATWYPNPDLNIYLDFYPEWTNDWLMWEGGTSFGRYARRSDSATLNLSWFPAPRHEVRLKSEWVAIRARDGQSYRLQPSGAMAAQGSALNDFNINNFGFQLRYKYSLGPQSDFFAAYSRGGAERNANAVDSFGLFENAIGLRDADQFFMKLRYRF